MRIDSESRVDLALRISRAREGRTVHHDSPDIFPAYAALARHVKVKRAENHDGALAGTTRVAFQA